MNRRKRRWKECDIPAGGVEDGELTGGRIYLSKWERRGRMAVGDCSPAYSLRCWLGECPETRRPAFLLTTQAASRESENGDWLRQSLVLWLFRVCRRCLSPFRTVNAKHRGKRGQAPSGHGFSRNSGR